MKHIASILFNKSKLALAVFILFVCGLLSGVFFSFPEMKIKQYIISSIETQAHVVIDQGDIRLGFLSIKGSDLLIRPENPFWPTISINSFYIAPQWLSLFSPNPGVHMDMQLFGGKLRADMSRDGALKVVASQLNLGLISPADQALKVSGQLVELALASVIPLDKDSESLLALSLKNVNIAGNSDFPLALKLGDIAINGTGRGRSFKISSLQADKGDLSINGKGNVLLGRDLASTQVNMKIDLVPEDNVDPLLVELITLGARQTPGGSYELNLFGVLSELSFHTP